MTRVLHLRSAQELYGAERSLLALAAATEAPFEPQVVSLVRPGREDVLGAAATHLGLPAVRVGAPGRLSLSALGPLIRLARGGLLHAHDYKALVLALAAGAVARAPVVATFHGDTGHLTRVVAYERLARWAARFTSGVAATSGPLAEHIRAAAPRTPVHVIPNGIPVGPPPTLAERLAARRALELPDGAQVVAFVGRLSPEKAPEVLLQAVRGTDMRVVVAGEGPLRPSLEAEARGAQVRFLGFVPDVGRVLAAADVLALPSRTEGLPMAVLEAMAAGVPVVASAVGSLPEVLGDGAGVLVPPGEVAALRLALEQLARPELRAALASAARTRVESRYGVAAMARSYRERLYQPALESTRGRARSPLLQLP
ncbi:MAG TPA: glycosyltransferase family 4 protein [Myxococcaceae bacterium]|nr:glycosyltransferase family 4 protein [Myxococcaceae bacterium]